MNQNSMYFIGLDLGDKHSHLALLDQNGDLIEETRLPTTRATFHRKFSLLPDCRVAMEVGTHSRWASHLLSELGHEVLVANARPKTPGTSGQAQNDLQQPSKDRPGRRRDPGPPGPTRPQPALPYPPSVSPGSS